MGNELGKDDIRLVNKLLQSDDPKALWAVADLGGQYDSTEHGRQTMTLGQRLLLNNGWKGALDLNDEESRERFEAYTTPMKMLPSPAPTPHARRA
jgi:hypothetical protein